MHYLTQIALLIVQFIANFALWAVHFSYLCSKRRVMDISLIQFMRERIEYTSTTFHRYLYNRLDWGRQMLGLVGPRGVGKDNDVSTIYKGASVRANMLLCFS